MTKTTTRKTTTKTTKAASKTTSARSTAATAKAPIPVIVSESTPTVTDPALKKKELIDTVTELSGVKRKYAKPVVEAMLEFLGKTLSEERDMNIQPLGKIKINRTKDVQSGKVLITKIRQSNRTAKAATAAE